MTANKLKLHKLSTQKVETNTNKLNLNRNKNTDIKNQKLKLYRHVMKIITIND